MALAKMKETAKSDELGQMGDSARDAAEFLKALAHESRLLILCLLSEGEKSVTELEELLARRQSTISQQLARLRLEGLVSSRRDGKSIYYSLANDDVRTILTAIHKVFCSEPGSPCGEAVTPRA
jgi:DNA-binding transcriptional ArsR family regulator